MALRDSKLFRAIAYTMAGLALATFVLRVLSKVEMGNGADIYLGGRGMPIPYVAALVTIVAVALVGVIWFFTLAWRRWRHLLVRDNNA